MTTQPAPESESVSRLRRQVGGPRDGALLRYSIGSTLLNEGQPASAAVALREALRFDADYSAAWKLLGQALADSGDTPAAMAAYRDGIAAAGRRGDKQAEKEMGVFLRRLQKSAPP